MDVSSKQNLYECNTSVFACTLIKQQQKQQIMTRWLVHNPSRYISLTAQKLARLLLLQPNEWLEVGLAVLSPWLLHQHLPLELLQKKTALKDCARHLSVLAVNEKKKVRLVTRPNTQALFPVKSQRYITSKILHLMIKHVPQALFPVKRFNIAS